MVETINSWNIIWANDIRSWESISEYILYRVGYQVHGQSLYNCDSFVVKQQTLEIITVISIVILIKRSLISILWQIYLKPVELEASVPFYS